MARRWALGICTVNPQNHHDGAGPVPRLSSAPRPTPSWPLRLAWQRAARERFTSGSRSRTPIVMAGASRHALVGLHRPSGCWACSHPLPICALTASRRPRSDPDVSPARRCPAGRTRIARQGAIDASGPDGCAVSSLKSALRRPSVQQPTQPVAAPRRLACRPCCASYWLATVCDAMRCGRASQPASRAR